MIAILLFHTGKYCVGYKCETVFSHFLDTVQLQLYATCWCVLTPSYSIYIWYQYEVH